MVSLPTMTQLTTTADAADIVLCRERDMMHLNGKSSTLHRMIASIDTRDLAELTLKICWRSFEDQLNIGCVPEFSDFDLLSIRDLLPRLRKLSITSSIPLSNVGKALNLLPPTMDKLHILIEDGSDGSHSLADAGQDCLTRFESMRELAVSSPIPLTIPSGVLHVDFVDTTPVSHKTFSLWPRLKTIIAPCYTADLVDFDAWDAWNVWVDTLETLVVDMRHLATFAPDFLVPSTHRAKLTLYLEPICETDERAAIADMAAYRGFVHRVVVFIGSEVQESDKMAHTISDLYSPDDMPPGVFHTEDEYRSAILSSCPGIDVSFVYHENKTLREWFLDETPLIVESTV